MKELQAIVRTLVQSPARSGVLATLVRVEGSSYRRPGARLLLLPDGTRIGSISGGCLEEDVLARARRVEATGKPEVVVYDTTSENDLVWGVGLGCHGVVRVLVEKLPPAPAWAVSLDDCFRQRKSAALRVSYENAQGALGTTWAGPGEAPGAGDFVQVVPPPLKFLIFGAGDDAQPLARLGSELGWSVTVCDPRPAFASAARFPTADEVIAAPAADLVARAAPDRHSVAVVMTHHYVHDRPVLRDLLPQPLPYLGLLGPKKRAQRILDDLRGEGVVPTAQQLERLHAPVGLDLGADGPEQVALAIVAEIQATLASRPATPLRARTGPIHA